MKWLHLFLLLLIALLSSMVYNLWFNPNTGTHRLAELQITLKQYESENERLKERNKKLEINIDSLKNDYDAREELARKNLGLIQEDETFFHITPEDANDE